MTPFSLFLEAFNSKLNFEFDPYQTQMFSSMFGKQFKNLAIHKSEVGGHKINVATMFNKDKNAYEFHIGNETPHVHGSRGVMGSKVHDAHKLFSTAANFYRDMLKAGHDIRVQSSSPEQDTFYKRIATHMMNRHNADPSNEHKYEMQDIGHEGHPLAPGTYPTFYVRKKK